MSKISYMTEEGLKKLKDELDYMESVERPSISRQIAEARDKGDLSENAEYDAAREAQSLLEIKILKLRELIANSRILDNSRINIDSVQIMTRVKIKNRKNNQVVEYVIVSETEADLKAGKISVETPIAKGLMGKKVGDVVDVKVPAGVIPFEIIEISR